MERVVRGIIEIASEEEEEEEEGEGTAGRFDVPTKYDKERRKSWGLVAENGSDNYPPRAAPRRGQQRNWQDRHLNKPREEGISGGTRAGNGNKMTTHRAPSDCFATLDASRWPHCLRTQSK